MSKTHRQTLSVASPTAAKAATVGAKPAGPNPYLALVPDPTTIDYAGWRRYLETKADIKAVRRDQMLTQYERKLQLPSPLVVDEDEPEGIRGSNDTTGTAQPVPGFGTGMRKNPRARVLGTLSPEQVSIEAVAPNAEDDGSIPLAADTGIGSTREGIRTSAEIGDGPHGSSGSDSGDFDFYEVHGVAGETLTVNIDTPVGGLDSMVALYDASGEIVAFNDDVEGDFDSLLKYSFATDGDYYAMVTGFPVLPGDPFDSGSGTGAASEGPYDLEITIGEADIDFYAVRLHKGDVLGASVEGSVAQLTVYDRAGVNVQGSMQDLTFIYPAQTPLPGGGNAVTEHVADQNGWHYAAVSEGDGDYDLTVEAYRPRLEDDRPVQTIFLDFNGERLNTAIWGGPGVRTLSPLRAFLGRWGLTNRQHNALTDAIIAETRENLRRDMIASGLNDDFRLRVLNSRDHRDVFGRENVSRVIVGGTIEQSGIPTIGVAQSIDPGNFATEESALVLLDILSDPAGDFGDPSLNTYVGARSNEVAFVGQAVGNIVSHEAGHFFGNWHVDQFNEDANLMDQGGNFPVLYGVGPDGVGGTRDDTDVDFGEDVFNPNEGFTGIEDTLSRLALVLTR